MYSITSISLENSNTLPSIMFVIFSIKSSKLLLDLLLGAYNVLLLQIGLFIMRASNSVQFSSVAQSCPALCDPMNHSTPGLPVPHHLPEFTQTHIHRVDDAIQPSHPLSSPFLPAPNPSQHQSLFQWVNSTWWFLTKQCLSHGIQPSCSLVFTKRSLKLMITQNLHMNIYRNFVHNC